MDHVILNHGQVTWTTPELAPPLLTTTPHQREDVSALDRFSVHRCPTRRPSRGGGVVVWRGMPAQVSSSSLDQGSKFRGEKSLENRRRRLGRPRDLCDLPIRRDEGRVVNTPLVFKRVLFQEKGGEGRGDGKGERE
ncbi:uncharacterized protein TNCV_1840141 [Trichonephila clavipes]|nr:uncharacterized protein TNCV_1840141 [Trichonephila clavipes]